MFEDRARVLLILPQDVLDRARVFAGEAMTKLKGPVSLQMVLRALIDDGLRRERDRALLTNIEVQMRAVREVRNRGRRPAAMARSTRAGARASGRRS
jgi:hypothetical protein